MFSKTWQTGGNKYKAVKQTYNGNKYDSKREASKAWELDAMLRAKQIKSWTRQVKIPLLGENGTRVCNYFCDFMITHLDDSIEYLEIKSKITATPIWRLKWKLTEDKFKNDKNVRLTVEY